MDHAHGDLGLLGGEARQVGFGADDGEGALVDRGAVAQIGLPLSHGRARRFGGDAHDLGDERRRHRRDNAASRAPSRCGRCRSRARFRPRSAAAGAGWAQPLAQPEMWMVTPSRRGGSCRAIVGRQRARRDHPRGADRLAGAGDDAAARVVGAHDEAERARLRSRAPPRRSGGSRSTTARGRARAARARRHGRRRRSASCSSASACAWPNGERDAERDRAVPQRMAADRLGRRTRRRRRRRHR